MHGRDPLKVFRNVLLLVLGIAAPVVGYYFAQRFGEPYPWLIMPGFSGDHRNDDGNYVVSRTDVTVVFDDERTEMLSLADLFAPAPSAAAIAVYANLIRPDANSRRTLEKIQSAFEPSAMGRFKRNLQRGYVVRERNRNPPAPHPETVAWLSNRVASLFPGREAQAIQFRKTRTLFDSSGNAMGDRVPEETEIELTIPLIPQ